MATAWKSQIDNDITHSTVARTYANGSTELQAHLAPIRDPRDGTIVGHLVPTAATSWNAMAAHAHDDGVVLIPISSGDTFRPLATQQRIFTDRYRTTDQGNGSRVCGGKRWYLRKGQAVAACPGTSNHGKGEAVDFQRLAGTLAWMEQHARSYGWAWELASEEWHVHYLLGDTLPAAARTAPVVQEDHDMPRVMTPAAPHRDFAHAFIVGDGIRTWIVDGEHHKQAEALYGPMVTVSASYWDACVIARTATDIEGLRRIPPSQETRLVDAATGPKA